MHTDTMKYNTCITNSNARVQNWDTDYTSPILRDRERRRGQKHVQRALGLNELLLEV